MDTEGNIKLDQRTNFALIEDIKRHLSEENLRKFRSSCFGHFLDLDPNIRFDKGLHHYLLRRQDPSGSIKEVDFRIHGQWIKFAPREFAMVTGLKFPENEPPSISVSSLRLYDTYFSGYDKSKFKFPQLHTRFKGLGDFVSEDCLKIALLLVVYGILIAQHNHVLDLEYFSLVDDLEKFNSFPWGSLAYTFIIHDFRTRLSGRKETDSLLKSLTPIDEETNSDETVEINYKSSSLDVKGFPQALQYWALEAIPWLKYILHYQVDSTLPTIPARILRWKAGPMSKKKAPTAKELTEMAVRANEQPVDLPYRLEPSDSELDNEAYLSAVQWEKFTSVSEQHKEPSLCKKRKRQSGEDNIEGSSGNQRIRTERSEQVGGQSVRGQDKDPSLAAIELKQTVLEEMIEQIREGQRKMTNDFHEAIAKIKSRKKTIEDGSGRTDHEVNNLETYCDAELKTIRSAVEGIKTSVKSSLEMHAESWESLEQIQEEFHDMVKGFAERLGITLGHRGSDRPQVGEKSPEKRLKPQIAPEENKRARLATGTTPNSNSHSISDTSDGDSSDKTYNAKLDLLEKAAAALNDLVPEFRSRPPSLVLCELENLKREIATACSKEKEQETIISRMRHENTELSSRCASLVAGEKNTKEELTISRTKEKELESIISRLRNEITELSSENKKTKEGLMVSRSKEKELEASNSRLTHENATFSAQCAAFEAEYKRTIQELTVARSKEKEQEAAISRLTHKNKVFSAECSSYESQIVVLEAEYMKTKEELSNADRKFYSGARAAGYAEGVKDGKSKWLKSAEFLDSLTDASVKYFDYGFDSCQKQAEQQGFVGKLDKNSALNEALLKGPTK